LFLDSSALISAMLSEQGAAHALVLLSTDQQIVLTISQQVVAETERGLARVSPAGLPSFRSVLRLARLRIVRDPAAQESATHAGIISHAADVPIVVAAMREKVDFLVTLNRRHFIDDESVARRSGLRIGTPGDALAWLRQGATDDGKPS
jgi:predicted nucleic acid-binding protein